MAPSNPDVVALLRGLLDQQDERDRALATHLGPAAAPVEFDENLRRELRALGYLDDPGDD